MANTAIIPLEISTISNRMPKNKISERIGIPHTIMNFPKCSNISIISSNSLSDMFICLNI